MRNIIIDEHTTVYGRGHDDRPYKAALPCTFHIKCKKDKNGRQGDEENIKYNIYIAIWKIKASPLKQNIEVMAKESP